MNKYISSLSAAEEGSKAFDGYVEQGKLLAAQAGLIWEMNVSEDGVANGADVWDLRKLLKDGSPAQAKLRTFSIVPKALAVLIAKGLLPSNADNSLRPVSVHWQNLMKAFAVNALLVSGRMEKRPS